MDPGASVADKRAEIGRNPRRVCAQKPNTSDVKARDFEIGIGRLVEVNSRMRNTECGKSATGKVRNIRHGTFLTLPVAIRFVAKWLIAQPLGIIAQLRTGLMMGD